MSRIDRTPSPFPMDSGIDKILRRESGGDAAGGPAADISPASSPVKPCVDLLYEGPTLEDFLLGAQGELTPLISDPLVLMPNRFGNALRAGAQSLEALAQDDPRTARVLRRAAALMTDQVTLRDLVQMYRSALLKG